MGLSLQSQRLNASNFGEYWESHLYKLEIWGGCGTWHILLLMGESDCLIGIDVCVLSHIGRGENLNFHQSIIKQTREKESENLGGIHYIQGMFLGQ